MTRDPEAHMGTFVPRKSKSFKTPRPRRAYIRKDPKGQWRYVVKAGNGKVIEKAEEGFMELHWVIARVNERHPGVVVKVEQD